MGPMLKQPPLTARLSAPPIGVSTLSLLESRNEIPSDLVTLNTRSSSTLFRTPRCEILNSAFVDWGAPQESCGIENKIVRSATALS